MKKYQLQVRFSGGWKMVREIYALGLNAAWNIALRDVPEIVRIEDCKHESSKVEWLKANNTTCYLRALMKTIQEKNDD